MAVTEASGGMLDKWIHTTIIPGLHRISTYILDIAKPLQRSVKRLRFKSGFEIVQKEEIDDKTVILDIPS